MKAELLGLKPVDVDEDNVHFQERRYGHFQRTIPLPSMVNSDAADA